MQKREEVVRQYAGAENLNTRIAFQQRFSQNKMGFSPWLVAQYDFPAHARVLELGCGTGAMWQNRQALIDGFDRLVLTDFSEGMLETTKETLSGLHGIEFQQADIQELPFADGSFDFIIANMMLYHVPDRARAIGEVRRVLKQGGTFVCATYGEIGLPSYMGEVLKGIVTMGTLNSSFTLQNGAQLLKTQFAQVEKREYPDEFVVDDAGAIVDYLKSMTNMIVSGDFPEEEILAAIEQKMRSEGALHIPKQYGTFICQ